MPAALGRPAFPFDQEAADSICEQLATSDHSLRKICESDKLPSVATILKWLRLYPDFAAQYTRAREAQADHMFDIAGETVRSFRLNAKGDIDPASVTLAKNAWDDIRWRAGKLRPKKYGEKIEMEHSGGVILINDIPDPDYSQRDK